MATKRTTHEILSEGKRKADAALLRMRGAEIPLDRDSAMDAQDTYAVRECEIQMRLTDLQETNQNLLKELIGFHLMEAIFLQPTDEAQVEVIRARKALLNAQIGQEFAYLEPMYSKAIRNEFLKTDAFDVIKPQKIAKSSVHKPPKGGGHPDFFVPSLYDIATKDSRDIMDVAVFRLSKKDKRANETIRYDRPGGYVEVVSGEAGMASVWDYDIVLLAISHLTESMNLYKQGRGEKPSRFFRSDVSEILKFCRRSDGGRQYEEIEGALKRLSTTFVEVVTTTQAKGKRALRTAKGVGLINSYETVSYADNGRLASVSIEVPQWLYTEVVEVKTPVVLTVHPEYFLIDSGIGRFLYRLARRAAGKARAKWTFNLIYERSGSGGTFKKFTFILRKLIASNDLPEYTLAELSGKAGPLLVITHRDAHLDELLEADEGEKGNSLGNDADLKPV